jgi:hypothetical protein
MVTRSGSGVRSRRDLVGKVFFVHYEPRLRDNERRAIADQPLRGGPYAGRALSAAANDNTEVDDERDLRWLDREDGWGRVGDGYGSGGWGFESLAAHSKAQVSRYVSAYPSLVLIISGPTWSALVDDRAGRLGLYRAAPPAIRWARCVPLRS